jgi:hypothetical protein
MARDTEPQARAGAGGGRRADTRAHQTAAAWIASTLFDRIEAGERRRAAGGDAFGQLALDALHLARFGITPALQLVVRIEDLELARRTTSHRSPNDRGRCRGTLPALSARTGMT